MQKLFSIAIFSLLLFTSCSSTTKIIKFPKSPNEVYANNNLKEFFKTNKTNEGFGIIPLKAGLKFFPTKNVYIAAEAGAGFGTKKGAGTSFVYSPSIGLAFGDGFDASLKYENFTDYNGYAQQLALRLAYGFKL